MTILKFKRTLLQVFCIAASALFVFPIVLMLVKSFSVDGIENYKLVFDSFNLMENFASSVLIVGCTLVLVAVVISLAAFAFSKLEFPLKKTLYYVILMGLMIPVSALIFPLFHTVKSMGMLGSRLSVVLPYVTLNCCFSLMMFKNYFDSLPDQLMEAAYIDGAGMLRIFSSIMMPIAKSGLAFVLSQTFLNAWNELQMAMIFISDQSRLPISVIPIRFAASATSTKFPTQVMFAALTICLFPIAVFYIFASKSLISGLTQGAVKG